MSTFHLNNKTLFLQSEKFLSSLYRFNLKIATRVHNCWAPVAHAYNPSYSGGRNQEDHSSKPAPGKQATRPYLKKTFTRQGWSSSATPPTTGVGEDAGKKEPSYAVGGNVD
jgi:hypothetical protein